MDGHVQFADNSRKDHPEQKFNIGNLETLGNVDRKELIEFYNKYYSANRMGLSLLSTHTLDEMEQWVRSYFQVLKTIIEIETPMK